MSGPARPRGVDTTGVTQTVKAPATDRRESCCWAPPAAVRVDPEPITKEGYWITGEGWYPVNAKLTIGGSVSWETVGREDSLVKYMATLGQYGVTTGKEDRMTVFRVFADFTSALRVGFYRVLDENPYPWLSGTWPVEGPKAFTGSPTDKWGIVVILSVH